MNVTVPYLRNPPYRRYHQTNCHCLSLYISISTSLSTFGTTSVQFQTETKSYRVTHAAIQSSEEGLSGHRCFGQHIPLTFAAVKNPPHLPNVLAKCIPKSDLFSSTSSSPPTAYGWSDLEDNEDNLEETFSSPPDLAPPVVSGLQSKITSFWKIATQIEKEETNQREFQKLRDDFEVKAANIAEGNRRKLARGRMQVRERQQAHRDRSKEKKMEAGWVPGDKWVISFYNPS